MQDISIRQLNATVFIFLTGNLSVFEPRAVADAAGSEALVSIIMATLAGVLLTAVWFLLARRFPDTDLFRYSSVLLGTPLGQVAAAVCLFSLLVDGARSTAKVGILGTAAFGWGTAVTVPVLLLAVIALFLLTRLGLRTIASLCEYAAPLVIVLVTVAVVTVLAKANWANLTFLAAGWAPALKGALILTGRFCLAWVVLLLLPRTRNVKDSTMLTIMGTIVLVGCIMAICTVTIASYGARTVASSFIPSLQMMTDSLWGRNPTVLSATVAFWMVGMALKTGAAYWLLCIALAETSSTVLWRFIAPVGAAILVLALVFRNDPTQTYIFIRQGMPYFSYSAGIGIPLLLLLIARLRGRRPVRTASQT